MCILGCTVPHSRQQTTIQEVRPIAREPRVNDKIRAREVRLVDPNGGQIGIKSIEEARWLADQLELDLVEVAAEARPPVVRMMDYGKFKYEQSVKAREARKKQTRTVIKEVQFRPKIGEADFDVKQRRVERFLGEGDKVKVTMRFRGREVTHPEIGFGILKRLAETVEHLGEVELMPRLDGRQMTMVLAPVRRPEGATTDEPGPTEAATDEPGPTEAATDKPGPTEAATDKLGPTEAATGDPEQAAAEPAPAAMELTGEANGDDTATTEGVTTSE